MSHLNKYEADLTRALKVSLGGRPSSGAATSHNLSPPHRVLGAPLSERVALSWVFAGCLLRAAVTESLTLGNSYRKEVYLPPDSGDWKIQIAWPGIWPTR